MKAISKIGTAMLAGVLLSVLCTVPASAGCAPTPGPKSGAFLQQPYGAELLPASFSLVSSQADVDPIVGFWKFTLSVQGQVVDAGYAQWHSDHTEIMNSSRPPATGSFCMGVWKRVIGRTYKLNHFALSWNPDGTFQGPAQIQEKVTLAQDGKSFSGSFALDQYDPNGNLLFHADGDVAATRLNIHSKLF